MSVGQGDDEGKVGIKCTKDESATGCFLTVLLRSKSKIAEGEVKAGRDALPDVVFGGKVAKTIMKALPADASGRIGGDVSKLGSLKCSRTSGAGFPTTCSVSNPYVTMRTSVEKAVTSGALSVAEAREMAALL